MVKFSAPATAEDFEASWKIVDGERCKAKKKYVITNVASFFGNMTFACLILIVGNGLLYDHLTGSYRRFLESIPYLLTVWEKISSLILKPDYSVALQIALPLLLVYAVCFAVCGVFVLLVTALYHPFKRKLPAESAKENASQMLAMAKDARRYSRRISSSGSMFWALIFMIVQFCVFALYIVIEVKDLGSLMITLVSPVINLAKMLLPDITETQLAYMESGLFIPSLMVFCLGMYLMYALASYIHALSVHFMYQYPVPYSFVADVEAYYIFADENTEGMTEDEIKKSRKETAEAKRTEALELERICAYGKAKELLAAAAHGGDPAAMEHYARHWLIAGAMDPAKYWLRKCAETGEAGEFTTKTLRRIKWRLPVRAQYLK